MTTEIVLKGLMEMAEGITVGTDEEAVLAIYEGVQLAKNQIREVEQKLKDHMIEWINANCDIIIGTRRLYVGSKKKTSCDDIRGAFEVLLQHTKGDLGEFIEQFLTSQPLKHGACKKVMEGQYDNFFSTTKTDDIMTGKPKKELLVADERYIN